MTNTSVLNRAGDAVKTWTRYRTLAQVRPDRAVVRCLAVLGELDRDPTWIFTSLPG